MRIGTHSSICQLRRQRSTGSRSRSQGGADKTGLRSRRPLLGRSRCSHGNQRRSIPGYPSLPVTTSAPQSGQCLPWLCAALRQGSPSLQVPRDAVQGRPSEFLAWRGHVGTVQDERSLANADWTSSRIGPLRPFQTFPFCSSMSQDGATTTSSAIAGKVCFQEAAKPISTAEMRRIAKTETVIWPTADRQLSASGKQERTRGATDTISGVDRYR